MNRSNLKNAAPVIIASAVAILFGLGVYCFVQAYGGFLGQKAAFETTRTRVRLIKLQKDELILKKKILDQTALFLEKADENGLEPSNWTVYDVSLSETIDYDKADQILNQCSHSQVAYFQPQSLNLKILSRQAQGNQAALPDTPKNLILNIQGRFLARKP